MKEEDIVVGKRYKHPSLGKFTTCLGIGVRRLYTINEFVTKDLVIIDSDDFNDVGLVIQKGEDSIPGFWDGFYPASEVESKFGHCDSCGKTCDGTGECVCGGPVAIG